MKLEENDQLMSWKKLLEHQLDWVKLENFVLLSVKKFALRRVYNFFNEWPPLESIRVELLSQNFQTK